MSYIHEKTEKLLKGYCQYNLNDMKDKECREIEKGRRETIKDYVLLSSFVLTVGSWVCGLYESMLGVSCLTGTVGLLTVSALWLYVWLAYKIKKG